MVSEAHGQLTVDMAEAWLGEHEEDEQKRARKKKKMYLTGHSRDESLWIPLKSYYV